MDGDLRAWRPPSCIFGHALSWIVRGDGKPGRPALLKSIGPQGATLAAHGLTATRSYEALVPGRFVERDAVGEELVEESEQYTQIPGPIPRYSCDHRNLRLQGSIVRGLTRRAGD